MKRLTIAALATMLFAISAAAQSFYEIRNIGVLPGKTWSNATNINNDGIVIGISGSDPYPSLPRAFAYRDCGITDLGTLGGNESYAQGINDQGTIVGWSRRDDGTKGAFSYFGGVMSDLGGKFVESASAISSWGIPVGVESAAEELAGNAVFYYGGKTYALPSYLVNPPYGNAYVQAVTDLNNTLRVTGYLQSDSAVIGLVSAPGFGNWTQIPPIPELYPSVVPHAINENGHVVGGAGQVIVRAFLSTDPSLPTTDLGTLGGQNSVAHDINNGDWIVGWSDSSSTSGPLAFLYNGSTMIDLNSRLINGTGWSLKFSTSINDNGWIAGTGFYNGQFTAFLLIPRRYPWLVTPGCDSSPSLFTP